MYFTRESIEEFFTGRFGSYKKLAALSVSGLLINLIGWGLSKALGLPIYLDTAGTILSSVLGGYLPGVLAGFTTNLIKSLHDGNELYFSSVNMFVAVISAYFTHKGYYKDLKDSLMTVFGYVFSSGILGSVISWFIYTPEDYSASSSVGQYLTSNLFSREFGAALIHDLAVEFFDKGLIILFVCAVIRFLPVYIKELFGTLDDHRSRYFRESETSVFRSASGGLSLRMRMLLLLTLSSLFISASSIGISYVLYKEYMIKEHIRMSDGVISLLSREIDPERVEEYLSLGHEAEGYDDVLDEMYKLKDSYPDAVFLYVYKIMPDGCHVVFDIDSGDTKASETGSVEPFDDTFRPYLDRLLEGREIEPIISDDYYGYLLTVYKPLYDASGNCRCYAAVDFSMNLLTIYGGIFFARLISLFVSFFILFLTLGLTFVERNIILPVNAMAVCADSFAYNSEEQRSGNVESIRRLDIRTGDEIENLYRAFLKTTEDSMEYVESLRRAKVEVADMKEQVSIMDEIAHNDSLTGVKNKTAYDEVIERLDGEIAAGTAAFGIVMIDVNFLKRMNDRYGHEHGNIYLGNCCEMICGCFGRQNIYRVGGDEFVAVLEGGDVRRASGMIKRFKEGISRLAASEDAEPWEKVSAAVGCALYEKGSDKSADQVFKRADKLMYENKIAMKAQRTD